MKKATSFLLATSSGAGGAQSSASDSCITIGQSDTAVLDPAVGTSASSLIAIANLYYTLT